MDNYIDKVKKRVKELGKKEPISESNDVQVISPKAHKCQWKKDSRQTHKTLTSFVCAKRGCGRGLMVDLKKDDIKNY